MAKYQDGQHILLIFEEHPGWEVIKGWHEVEHCQAEIRKEYGGDTPKVTAVRHQYGFWGVGQDEMGDPRQVFYEREEPGRGRFKVTLAVLDRGPFSWMAQP